MKEKERTSVIKVSGVDFAYDRQKVLRNIEFEIYAGEFAAVIGPNGGGKSTLLKLLLGILEPDAGKIEIFGSSPLEVRNEIGYVPQNVDVNTGFPITVLDVVMMGNKNRHTGRRSLLDRMFPIRYNDIEKRCAYSTLEKVGMESFIDRKIGELSGGERQRVMIARALCAHPGLLILDEPTSNIDAKGQKRIYTLLEGLTPELTIFVVSHDLSAVTSYANKVIYVNRESYMHDLSEKPLSIETPEGEHFCEVEMMQMLGERR